MTQPPGLQGRAVVGLGVRAAVGLVLVVAGWAGARGQVALDRQSPWIALSVAGLLVGAAAGAVWLLGVRRSVTERTLALLATVAALEPVAPVAPVEPAERRTGVRSTPETATFAPRFAGVAAEEGRRVRRRGEGVALYHRPGCPLVAGRAVVAGDAAGWRAEGLDACEACGA